MAKSRETILDIVGMTCHSCVRHVDRALNEVEGVELVEVRLREGQVSVHHDAEAAPVASLVKAIVEAGYSASER